MLRSLAVFVALWAFLSLRGEAPGMEDRGPDTLESLVREGKIATAVEKYRASYDYHSPQGLAALRRLGFLVLRRALVEEKDSYEVHDSYDRVFVAGSLARLGDIGGLEFLEVFLYSPDDMVRDAAAETLGETANASAVAILRRFFYEEEERGGGSRAAVRGLRRSGDRSAIGALLDAIEGGDPIQRIMAVEGLGEMGGKAEVSFLQALFAKEKEPFIKCYIARSLALLGDNSGLDFLKQSLANNVGEDVRDAAAGALPVTRDPSVIPLLRVALRDRSEWVRNTAAASLMEMKDSSGVAWMREALHHTSWYVRTDAAESLTRADYGMARELILEAIHSRDPWVRIYAVKAVGERGTTSDIALLVDLLKDERESDVRVQVAASLGKIREEDCILPLLGLLRDETAIVRYTAAHALMITAERLLVEKEGGKGSGAGIS